MDRKTECQIVNTLWMRKGIFFVLDPKELLLTEKEFLQGSTNGMVLLLLSLLLVICCT